MCAFFFSSSLVEDDVVENDERSKRRRRNNQKTRRLFFWPKKRTGLTIFFHIAATQNLACAEECFHPVELYRQQQQCSPASARECAYDKLV